MDKIEVCPACRCRYRVAEELKGQTISCKHCGADFKLTFRKEDKPAGLPQTPQTSQKQVAEISCDDSYLLIGKLAVKYKYASVEQVKQALILKEQERQAGKDCLLGEILVQQGILSTSQLSFLRSVQKLLQTRKSDDEFGTIAVKNDFAGPIDIEQALSEQKRIFKQTNTVRTIGDILVDSGVLTPQQRDAILIRQQRMAKETVEGQKKPRKTNGGSSVEHRAKSLGISEVFIGVKDKLVVISSLLEKYQFEISQVAYMGDDLVDIPVFVKVGFSCAPVDAVKEVRESVDFVTKSFGGNGAVREVCDMFFWK